MSAVRRFEDLIARPKAGALTREVYPVFRQGASDKDRGLTQEVGRIRGRRRASAKRQIREGDVQ